MTAGQTTDTAATPTPEELAKAPILENWWAEESPTNTIYTSPEAMKWRLAGDVFGHPGFAKGEFVYTSVLCEYQPEAGWARTMSRLYRLGTMNAKYAEWLAQREAEKAADQSQQEYV